MTVNGIDVSKHQSTTPDLTGQDFLFARASIGTLTDYMYATHTGHALAAGLTVGAYHFNWSTLSVADQVAVFLRAAANTQLLVIDVEPDYSGGITTPAFTLAQTQEFISRVHAAGRRIGLYHSQSGFFDAGQDFNWVARWGSYAPSVPWAFWQWQGSPLDRNYFNGTIEQLRALAGVVAPPTPKWSWARPPELLPEGTTFVTTSIQPLWHPDKPGAPIWTPDPATFKAKWRLYIQWDNYAHLLPDGGPFIQIDSAAFPNGMFAETAGVLLPPSAPTPIPTPPPVMPPVPPDEEPAPPAPAPPPVVQLPGLRPEQIDELLHPRVPGKVYRDRRTKDI